MSLKTVLVVEDDDYLLEALQETLVYNGYVVTAAPNGHIALDLAQSLQPDAILCDIGIPKMNGYEVFDKLQHVNKTSGIPFVFVTGRSDREEIQNRTGVIAGRILLKPFSMEELLGILGNIWETHD